LVFDRHRAKTKGKKSMKSKCTWIIAFLVATSAMAGSQPFQLSLTPDIAIVDRSDRVNGVTLNIWGENPQTALALGFVNGSVGDSAGFSWAYVLNYADNYSGVQWAIANYNRGNFLGWQSALVNYTDASMRGLQTGAVNYAGNLSGLQLGLLNYADAVKAGVQIGLINLIPQNEWFSELPQALAPGMLFVNWRF